MKQTHLLRNSYRFLIDLVYPNRCPCCNQVIAWDAWICEACQIETALNPDTVCSGCGKPFDDCMCSESLAFDGAMTVSRYEGRARQGILQLKQAENLNFANYTGTVLGERILQKPDWMMADAIVPVPMQQHQWILRGTNPAETGLDDGGCHCSSTDAAASVDFTGKESGGTHCKCDFFWHKDSGSYGFALEKAGRNSAAYVECRTAAY